jgi:predicted ATPase
VWMWGAVGRGRAGAVLFHVFYSKKLVNAKKRSE